MRSVLIHNLSRDSTRPVRAIYCVSFFCRLRGLTFRRNLPPTQALLLVHSRDSRTDTAIHMFGVWFDLAVAWINSAGNVVDLRLARKWRSVYVPVEPARYVLEMAPERLKDFQIGDQIKFEEIHLD